LNCVIQHCGVLGLQNLPNGLKGTTLQDQLFRIRKERLVACNEESGIKEYLPKGLPVISHLSVRLLKQGPYMDFYRQLGLRPIKYDSYLRRYVKCGAFNALPANEKTVVLQFCIDNRVDLTAIGKEWKCVKARNGEYVEACKLYDPTDFVFQRLFKNDDTKFPHRDFWDRQWQAFLRNQLGIQQNVTKEHPCFKAYQQAISRLEAQKENSVTEAIEFLSYVASKGYALSDLEQDCAIIPCMWDERLKKACTWKFVAPSNVVSESYATLCWTKSPMAPKGIPLVDHKSKKPSIATVLEHLNALPEHNNKTDMSKSISKIYRYLSHESEAHDDLSLRSVTPIYKFNSGWKENASIFLPVTRVFANLKTDIPPFAYTVPANLVPDLVTKFRIKLLDTQTLSALYAEAVEHCKQTGERMAVEAFLTLISDYPGTKITSLPDSNFKFRCIPSLIHKDTNYHDDAINLGEIPIVHPRVPANVIQMLQVPKLTEKMDIRVTPTYLKCASEAKDYTDLLKSPSFAKAIASLLNAARVDQSIVTKTQKKLGELSTYKVYNVPVITQRYYINDKDVTGVERCSEQCLILSKYKTIVLAPELSHVQQEFCLCLALRDALGNPPIRYNIVTQLLRCRNGKLSELNKVLEYSKITL